MAGGQPFSMENLAAVRELTREHGVPFILDATRISENALFVKEREPGYEERSLRELIRLIADHADGAIFSSKKDHFVPIGGFVAVNDLELARRLREQVVVYEGFPHYGGMAGHDMEALAQGIRESTDERVVEAYVAQARYLGTLLRTPTCPSSSRSARTPSSSMQSGSSLLSTRRSSRPRRSRRRSTWPAAFARWSAESCRASTVRIRTTGSSSSG